MIEYLTIISTTAERFNWSWPAVEALGTCFSGILIFFTLIYTIVSSRKQISLEKEKFQQATEEATKRQRQQTFEIVKEFYSKKGHSLFEAISLLNDKINTYHFFLNEKNIQYLEALKEKAIALQKLDLQLKRANIEARQETDQETFNKKQAEIYKIEEEIGIIAAWLAERGDKVRIEI
jgi:hypothetical protein